MNYTHELLHVLKKLRINKIYRQIENYLPDSFKSSITSLTTKYGYTPLVIADEIKPQYKRAFSFLQKYSAGKSLGDYLEFGVCHGTSMECTFQVLKELRLKNVRLFGFDSFEGMPAASALEDEGKWKAGEYASSLEDTSEFLTKRGIDWNRTFLFKGWFSDTLTQDVITKHSITKASVIMIDCDIYSSTRDALTFCVPLIRDNAIIFFDDWIPNANLGERKAFDEFLKENPHLKAEKFGSYKPYGEIYLITNMVHYYQ